MTRKKIGYEVGVKVSGGDEIHVYCVDYTTRKIRGSYVAGYRHHISNDKLWGYRKNSGTMIGDFKIGGLVSILEPGEKPPPKGEKSNKYKIVELMKVDISEMIRDRSKKN